MRHLSDSAGIDPATDAAVAELLPGVAATQALREVGYTVAPFFGAEQVRRLEVLYASLGVDEDRPFFASCNDAERVHARRVDVELKELVGPAIQQLLPGHTPFLGSFVSKGRLVGGPMAFHQDLTYVDERVHRSVTVWIPLSDVDETSGALQVVPGSHRWSVLPRHGGTAPLAATELQDPLARLAVTLPARRGDAVLFDSALLHGSTHNGRDQVRVAAVVAFAPADATLVHFHQNDGGPLEAFEIDEAFFTTRPFRSRPDGYREIEPWDRALCRDDLQRSLGEVPSAGGSTSSTEAAEPTEQRRAQVDGPGAGPRTVLRRLREVLARRP